MRRLYRYVGSSDIARGVRGQAAGHPVRSVEELQPAVAALGGEQWLTVTFVVDALGVLRFAVRSSEHVACAGHGPVLAAGELGVSDGEVVEASNQSTGFCPEPTCFPALAKALDEAGIPRVERWTAAFEFRRCEVCGGRTLIKEAQFECAECNAELAREWNFERTTVRRSFHAGWVIDAIEEPGALDQDRVALRSHADGLTLVLADGAGGTSHGAETAERVVELLASATVRRAERAETAVRGLDTLIASETLGECTGVLIGLSEEGHLVGASVGDSVAWARRGEAWTELTSDQNRKPLIGSGRARPVGFSADIDALLIASDGLSKSARWPDIVTTLGSEQSPWRLADLARLPSGYLADDLSAFWIRRAH